MTSKTPKISDRFEREFTRTFGALSIERAVARDNTLAGDPYAGLAKLKTPDGEPLHVDDESITDLLKRTGGQ